MSLTNESNFEFNNITENNYNRIQNTVSKVGYSDGITDGRESVFQKGFDTGYENGLLTGFELAKYKAFYEVIKKGSSCPDELKIEEKVYDHFNIPNAKDKVHFIGDGEDVPSLSKLQQEYVKQKTTIFAKDLPIATNLFSR